MTVAAIMQPTYLPWIGYFDMIDQADVFVFLDSVQFSKRSWQQRNRIKGPSGEIILTVPVFTKGKREQLILNAEVDYSDKFVKKHLQTIRQCYSKADFFDAYFPDLQAVLNSQHKYICDLNIHIIQQLMLQLGIKTPTLRSSSLDVAGEKAYLLTDICLRLNAETYLSAPGSKDYIEDDNVIVKNGINLIYHEYIHPEYRQLYGEFLPYMSCLDLLFNHGPRSRDILLSGRQTASST